MKKAYKVSVTTLGPVFVGCGQTLRKYQYLYNPDSKKVGIIDDAKFVEALRALGKYDIFVDGVSQNRVRNLRDFLRQHKINYTLFFKYALSVNALKETKSQLNDLSLFIRDGNGEAYIPGSSLKGALRTCILAKAADDTRENRMFRSLSVSDSTVIPNDAFEVYQKIDYTSPNKQPSSLSLYRECVRPGVSVHFTLSFNDEEITLAQIITGIKKTYTHYHNNWANHVKPSQIHPNAMGDKLLFYLGGGSGFVSKTLHYKEKPAPVAKRDVLGILKKYLVYKKVQNPKNVPMAVKIATTANGDKELGLCEITFEELEMRL